MAGMTWVQRLIQLIKVTASRRIGMALWRRPLKFTPTLATSRMNKLIEKPHLIFLLAIPMIMLIGILSEDAVLDINVHDTYYVIAYLHLSILISILFGIFGIVYWIMLKADRKLSKWLNWTHIGLTFGGTLIVWVLTKFYRTEVMELSLIHISEPTRPY